MDKNGKWFKACADLWEIIKKYGDRPVTNETEFMDLYNDVKECSKDKDSFVVSLFVAFVREKEREMQSFIKTS